MITDQAREIVETVWRNHLAIACADDSDICRSDSPVYRASQALLIATLRRVYDLSATDAYRVYDELIDSGESVHRTVEYVKAQNTIEITIDTEGGVQSGSALIYCRADSRLDGRAGRTSTESGARTYYVETYGEGDEARFVTGASWRDALRKLAKSLGYSTVTFKTEKD